MDTNLGRVIGYDGKQIELSRDSLYIKWRYVGDTVWKNLIALNDLKVGLPKGGKTNQVLAKLSNKDWDYVWKTPEGGGGSIDTIELASITTAPEAPFPINTKYYNANDNIIYKATEENTWENADTEEPVLGAFYIYDDEIYFYDKKFQSLYMVKQTPCESQSTAYIALNKVKNYLYQATFANIDYDFANDYFKTRKPNVVLGGCSTIRNGNFIGRNYDWFYSEDVSFVVNTPRINGKYASVSVSTSIPGLTQEYMTAGDYDQSLFKLIPFFALDGVNEYGVSVSDLVVHIEEDYGITTGTEPNIQKKDEVCALMLPRYILDNFKSAQEAVEYIRDYVSVYTLESLKNVEYELHFMVSDNIKSYCLEFINNKVEVINITSTNPYMTNFYLHNITTIDSPIVGIPQGGVYTPATVSQGYLPTSLGIKPLGDGLERWNLIVSNYTSTNTKNGMQALMANTLKYTKSYLATTNPQWNTEFVGDWDFDFEDQHYTISLTVDSLESDYEIVKEYVRTYYERGIRDSKTWHTEHSSVYDLKEKKLYLIVQEDGQELEFGLNYYTKEEIKNNLVWEKGTGENSVQTIQSEVNKNNAAGDSSVSEGAATDAHSFASHAEGYMTSTGINADYSHAEGYKTSTQGVASHAEGDSTVTNNPAEHAEGRYNKSNMGGTDATNTLSSIGIGNGSGSIPGGERKNAVEVMQNGDVYVKGIGGYDGKNPSEADTLQKTINTVIPNEITNSGSSLPAGTGYSLGDTFLNTTQKKLYTKIANNYRLNTGVTINGDLDLDYSTGIAKGFTNGSYQVSEKDIYNYNFSTNLIWSGNTEYRIHFKINENITDVQGLFAVYTSSSSTYLTRTVNVLIDTNYNLVLRLNYSQQGPSTIYKSDMISNYTLQVGQEYYLTITKTGNTAEIKLYSDNYGGTELSSQIISTEDWYVTNYNYRNFYYGGHAYDGYLVKAFLQGQIYLVDSTGEFLVADGTPIWDSGTALTNLSQYADITNGILYFYCNNQLFSNVVEFSKINGSPYDNSALTNILNSKADSYNYEVKTFASQSISSVSDPLIIDALVNENSLVFKNGQLLKYNNDYTCGIYTIFPSDSNYIVNSKIWFVNQLSSDNITVINGLNAKHFIGNTGTTLDIGYNIESNTLLLKNGILLTGWSKSQTSDTTIVFETALVSSDDIVVLSNYNGNYYTTNITGTTLQLTGYSLAKNTLIWKNTVLLMLGQDYTINGDTITFTTTLISSDDILVSTPKVNNLYIALSSKQDKLPKMQNGKYLTSDGNSLKWDTPQDTTYTAGTGIGIINNVISNTKVMESIVDSTSTTVTLSPLVNKAYTYTQSLTSLTLTDIPTSLDTITIEFTTDSITQFTLTATQLVNKWWNQDTPEFDKGETYIICIYNGKAILSKLGE